MSELSFTEEFDIEAKITMPHLNKNSFSAQGKQTLSQEILARQKEDVLLISPIGFSTSFIFAGLTEKHIEYLAQNAPRDYKENLWKIANNDIYLQEAFQIARAMDADLGEDITQNRQRVQNVIRYIRDNRFIFQF